MLVVWAWVGREGAGGGAVAMAAAAMWSQPACGQWLGCRHSRGGDATKLARLDRPVVMDRFEFDEQVQDGDTLVENLGVKLLVDPMSLQYLSGAEIDYREGLEGAQFVIRNPNATTTCGCGSSFAA